MSDNKLGYMGISNSHISWPWTVRFAIAQLEIGKPVPSWLHQCAQMKLNGEGCTSQPTTQETPVCVNK